MPCPFGFSYFLRRCSSRPSIIALLVGVSMTAVSFLLETVPINLMMFGMPLVQSVVILVGLSFRFGAMVNAGLSIVLQVGLAVESLPYALARASFPAFVGATLLIHGRKTTGELLFR